MRTDSGLDQMSKDSMWRTYGPRGAAGALLPHAYQAGAGEDSGRLCTPIHNLLDITTI